MLKIQNILEMKARKSRAAPPISYGRYADTSLEIRFSYHNEEGCERVGVCICVPGYTRACAGACLRMWLRACVHKRVRVSVRACVHACERAYVCLGV